MGTYNITLEEFEDKFEKFLKNFEGDVCADLVADGWNRLCDKYHWTDYLRLESHEPCNLEVEVLCGLVTDVKGLPSGWTYEVVDRDIQEVKENENE